jgi:hypothetical protein
MTNIMLHNGELTYAEVLGDRFRRAGANDDHIRVQLGCA